MMQEDVLEGLPIGVLFLSNGGDLVFSNRYAQQICSQLQDCSKNLSVNISSFEFLPPSVRRICQAVIDSRELFPEQPIIIEDSVESTALTPIQLRARWLELEFESYILVMLEPQSQHQSIQETQQFDLTDRETEVWLLRQAGYSYASIADQLQITLNAVKAQLQSIHAKRGRVEGLRKNSSS